MQVEWDKSSVQELDITGTDLSTECLIDMLTRIPNLRFLSAGQLNGFTDSVLKAFMESGNLRWAYFSRAVPTLVHFCNTLLICTALSTKTSYPYPNHRYTKLCSNH